MISVGIKCVCSKYIDVKARTPWFCRVGHRWQARSPIIAGLGDSVQKYFREPMSCGGMD